ncbi:MAG: DNA gyrase subunit A [Nitrospira sp.]|jgi:DNA gyrase subunit A|uniref:DNA gyrase subunit A n=1 Tax=Nitrospira sp. ND1 TaxID=1658518 RepID=UPI0009BBC6BE|nr:DNA gyrase subunit A [Nitrospira sp. ND1]MBK7418356.1 DNA gyrase subunit A [Nitrospira sp.]OYT24827.1 MAG: DNA gyrase subunit A [Nitrospira sp. UW-LDO-02]MBK7484887.1 DNA gyrase subunit A [Nitrospira sp.]MBK8376671.1 DNA gyrase subunit A [Nitrospira sp.]MBK9998022.1 DNA gyrase subunit A [Nitrospira sp.]
MPPDERLGQIAIEDEMRSSYLDYAMSVIVGRALPDVRDGLKPVHRRILHGMNEMGLAANRPYRKSAKIVGEIMGNYHPHGDSAIYDTLVRMAQNFNMRYMLVDGQGNYGSMDGDAAAAMRYTEARLTKLAEELLADIEKETVDFGPNYDESRVEPLVLPSRVPNLLVNGAGGIAVGYATNIPTHNLGEVIEGLLLLLENPDVTIPQLMKKIPGPDFPTAGFIYGTSGIKDAYETGRGLLTVRAKVAIETDERTDRERLIVTEIPYQVNKSKLIEKIADLAQEDRVTGISDIRDESDREGVRVVIELKRNEIPLVVLNNLYKHSQLQTTFGVNMLALVNNRPEVLNLKRILEAFVEHRREVVVRRTAYDLRKAEERAHILEGLKIALDNLDAVIALIRRSQSPDVARTGLMQQFRLSEIQANAILEMRLQRLTQLERDKLVEEYREVLKTIEYLRSVLGSEALVRKIIQDELIEIKDKYQDERRTKIVKEEAELTLEDLIAEEEVVVTISHAGYIKRNAVTLYRAQRRGGKGKIAMGIKEEDFVETLFTASTHDSLLFFTDAGKVYWLKVHEIPEASRAAKGKALVNLLALSKDEKVTASLPVKEFRADRFIIMGTKLGVIKKTELSAYSNPRQGGIIALSLDAGDKLIGVDLTDGQREILLGTKQGITIRFKEEDVRAMGRTAHGVRGITLEPGDEVIGMETITPDSTTAILTVTEGGYGKRTPVNEYRVQGRGGKGIISVKTTERNGPAVGFLQVRDEDEIMLMAAQGKVLRCKVDDIREIGRNTQGVRLLDMDGDEDRVVAVVRLVEREEGVPEEGES